MPPLPESNTPSPDPQANAQSPAPSGNQPLNGQQPDPAQPPQNIQPDPAKPNGSGTIYDKQNGNDPAQPPAGAWPADWREKASGGDAKKLERLKRYDSPDALANALIAAQDKIASGEYKKAGQKPDSKDEAALKAWREEQGLPADPKGYEIPNYDKLSDGDKKIADTMRQAFLDADVHPNQVQGLMKAVTSIEEARLVEQTNTDVRNAESVEDTLRADWGPEYRQNLAANFDHLTKSYGKELAEQILMARLPDGRRLADVPEWNRDLQLQARAAGTDPSFHGEGGGGASIDKRIAEIKEIMSTNFNEYQQKYAAEYTQLLERKEKMSGGRAAA